MSSELGLKGVNENAKITYTVKELLSEIHDDVKTINQKLDAKADRAELIALESTLNREINELRTQVEQLKNSGSATDAVDRYKRWFWPMVGSIAASMLATVLNIYLRITNPTH